MPVRIVGVAVAQRFRRGGDDGDAAARGAQRGEDALAARAVDVDGDGGFGRLVHRAIVAPNARSHFARNAGGGTAAGMFQSVHNAVRGGLRRKARCSVKWPRALILSPDSVKGRWS